MSNLFMRLITCSGQERIRTSEVERQRIYSPPHLAALEPALKTERAAKVRDRNLPTNNIYIIQGNIICATAYAITLPARQGHRYAKHPAIKQCGPSGLK